MLRNNRQKFNNCLIIYISIYENEKNNFQRYLIYPIFTKK